MSTPTSVVGEEISGRYRLERLLGEGGYGSVFEATALGTGQRCALKILHVSLGDSPEDHKRFEREAVLAQHVSHPHVVAVLDHGYTDDGLPFIAFELLRGQSLRDLLRPRHALAQSWVGRVARQTLEALAHAHGLGVVHRDIKPSNLLLWQDGPSEPFVKVLDFGIAKSVRGDVGAQTRLTATGTMVGTPHYMAPEQILGKPIGPPADLYGLGLVLAEMLGGQRVVQGGSEIDVLLAHLAEAPHELGPEVASSPVGPFIARAIAKPVEQRFESAEQMGAALLEALPLCAEPAVQPIGAPATTAPVQSSSAAPGSDSIELVLLDEPAPFAAAEPPGPRRSASLPVMIALAALLGLVLGGVAVGWSMALRWRATVAEPPDIPVPEFDFEEDDLAPHSPELGRSEDVDLPPGALDGLRPSDLLRQLEACGWQAVTHATYARLDQEGRFAVDFRVESGDGTRYIWFARGSTVANAQRRMAARVAEHHSPIVRQARTLLEVRSHEGGNPRAMLETLLGQLRKTASEQ